MRRVVRSFLLSFFVISLAWSMTGIGAEDNRLLIDAITTQMQIMLTKHIEEFYWRIEQLENQENYDDDKEEGGGEEMMMMVMLKRTKLKEWSSTYPFSRKKWSKSLFGVGDEDWANSNLIIRSYSCDDWFSVAYQFFWNCGTFPSCPIDSHQICHLILLWSLYAKISYNDSIVFCCLFIFNHVPLKKKHF